MVELDELGETRKKSKSNSKESRTSIMSTSNSYILRKSKKIGQKLFTKNLLEDLDLQKDISKIEMTESRTDDQNSMENLEEVEWQDLMVGDIVKIRKDEFFPADLVLLCSSNKKQRAYVETKNLDGESNLKMKETNDQLKDSLRLLPQKNRPLPHKEELRSHLKRATGLNLDIVTRAPFFL